MTSAERRKQFIRNEEQLVLAAGPVLPVADEPLMAAANEICVHVPREGGPDGVDRLTWGGGTDGYFHIPFKLAAAYQATHNDRYVRAAAVWFAYWLDRENFSAADWAPTDGLVIPHGVGDTEVPGWLGALPALLTSPTFHDALFERILAAVRKQLVFLADHLHTYVDNIRMTQHDCLLHSGLRLSFLAEAGSWRQAGVLGLNDMVFRLFHPDGSSVESTGWYHYIVANMARRHWRLQQAMPDLGLRVTAEQVARAFDYTVACIEPNGQFNGVGDASGRAEPFKTLAAVLTHRRTVMKELGLPEEDPPTRQLFAGAGQAILRSDWTSRATYVVFDATPSIFPAWHWHPGCNSIDLSVAGIPMLVDNGYMHFKPASYRAYALSTRAHNTLTINGWNQAPCAPAPLRHRHADGVDVVDALYAGGYWPGDSDGYRPGVFAEHHRTVLWVHDRFLVVIDHLHNCNVDAANKATIAAHWQCSPGDVVLGKNEALIRRDGVSLRFLFALRPKESALSVHCGEENPVRGWLAGAIPAPQICLETNQYAPAYCDMATVLIPGGETAPVVECVESAIISPFAQQCGEIALRWEDGSMDSLYWRRCLASQLGQIEDMATDAAMVLVSRTRTGAVRQALVYEGSYLSPWQDTPRSARATYTINQP